MNLTWLFAKRYFTGPVSLSALVCLVLAFIAALLSTGKNEWWKAYLQDLSTTLVGISATVWIINFQIEHQAAKLSSQLRAPTEQEALRLVRLFIDKGLRQLPIATAPDSKNLYQLEEIQKPLDRLSALCDGIAPGASDTDLHSAVAGFRLEHMKWCESMEALESLIRMVAPTPDRASAFDALKQRTRDLIESAQALRDALSGRHPHLGVILDLNDE
jgi:hypothetical protein